MKAALVLLCALLFTVVAGSSTAEVQGGELCQICQFAVASAEAFLSENTTQTEVENFLDNLCSLLPAEYSSMCTEFVNEYLPEAVSFILNEENPQALCSQLDLCSSITIVRHRNPAMKPRPHPKRVESGLCSICELLISAAESFVTENTTESEVEDFLDKVCNLLPSKDRPVCTSFVSTYVPEVFQMIIDDETPETVCQQVGVCDSSRISYRQRMNHHHHRHHHTAHAASAPEGDLCSICELAISAAENFLSENTTEEEIEQFVENLCSILPSEYASLCDAFVQEYLPEAIQFILDDETPSVACSELGLCTSVASANGEVCQLCEFAISAAESFLSENSTEQDIENFLGAVCSILPSEYSSLCTTFLDQYLPEAISYILNTESPEVACTQLGVCTSFFSPSGDLCGVCELAVTAAENFLSESSTETEIEGFLDRVCSILPAAYSSLCDNLVNTYTPEIVGLIVQKANPQDLCADVGACSVFDHHVARIEAGDMCQLCQFAVAAAESFLSENTTEEEVEQFVENLCALLPAEYSSMCDDFVQEYLPVAIEYILDNETPQVACSELGLCTSDSNGVEVHHHHRHHHHAVPDKVHHHHRHHHHVVPEEVHHHHRHHHNAPQEEGAGLCEVCELIISAAENFLSDNTTEEEIEQFVENICSILPSEYTAVCDSFVQNYLPEAIQYILDDETPSVACSQLGLCSSTVSGFETLEGELCQLCEFAISAAENFLSENSTEEEIETFLGNVCAILPSEYSSLCTAFLDEYLPEAISYILNVETPVTACSQLGVCSGSADVPFVGSSTSSSSDDSCALCEFCISTGESLYVSGTVDPTKLAAAIQTACSFLPSPYKTECDTFVSTNFSTIVKYIEDNESPETACQELDFC